jgi:hypothetical protein
MALEPIATKVLLSFRDRENTIGKTGFFLPVPGLLQVNAEAIYTKAKAIATAIQAISDCQLVDLSVTFGDEDNVTDGTGEVEKKGRFVFAVAGGTNYSTMIPGFKDSLLDNNKRTITVVGAGVNSDVQAFIDAVLNGPASFNNGATNAAGVNLARVVEARKVHVHSLAERRGKSG